MTYQHIDRTDPANQPQSGRHAGSCKRVPWARWGKVTALSVILSFLGAYFLGTVAPAQAATVRPHAASWTQRAYVAFTTWEKHPGRANLDALVADSFHLPAKYAGEDIAQLYSDVMTGAKATYLSDDKQYVAEDLDNCSGC